MAIALPHRSSPREGEPAVLNPGSSESGAYLIESIEYIPPTVLPPNSLFDDPDEIDALLEDTRTSIEDFDG
jgi:hypothetical protein